MRKIRLLVICFLVIASNVFAQQGRIDSLKLLPEQPTINDEVSFVCYTTFMSGDCNAKFSSFSLTGNTINFMLNYEVGDYTAICHSIDTFKIGKLTYGQYQLTSNLTINAMQAIFDTKSINFSIDQSSGIFETDTWKVNLSPNPCQNYLDILFIQDSHNQLEIQMFNSLGQKVKSQLIEKGVTNQINIADLNNGLYFLKITDGRESLTTRIIKN